MSTRLVLAGLMAFCAGCGKDPDRFPASTAATNPATATPVADPALEANQIAVVLAQLTQAARRYGAEQRAAPKSFEELVAKGYLSSVPQAPAGKKFAINKNLEVYLED